MGLYSLENNYCSSCKNRSAEVLELYEWDRFAGICYQRCLLCGHKEKVFHYFPTGGSGPEDIDDLRPENEPSRYPFRYLKDNESPKLTDTDINKSDAYRNYFDGT